jgi:hypothetical protein
VLKRAETEEAILLIEKLAALDQEKHRAVSCTCCNTICQHRSVVKSSSMVRTICG